MTDGFSAWLAQQQISLAFTTHRCGRLCLLGVGSNSELASSVQDIGPCMGMWADDQHLWISGLFQLWRFSNVVAPGVIFQGHDRLYVPRVGYTTGSLEIHDVAVDAYGRVIFVNTRFDCLASLAPRDSFSVLWKPSFIKDISPQDRCHLTGLALHDGQPRFVTAFAATGSREGWRQHLVDGGIIVDILQNRVVGVGLSMPHSPRIYRGRLWVLNSGTGYLGTINPANGRFEPLAFCPGYVRGLAFSGDYAVVGLSALRSVANLNGLSLIEAISRHGASALCGICVIDLRDGRCVHQLCLGGSVDEIYDLRILPGVVRPMALGF